MEALVLPAASNPAVEKVGSGRVARWNQTQRFDIAVDTAFSTDMSGSTGGSGRTGRKPILVIIIVVRSPMTDHSPIRGFFFLKFLLFFFGQVSQACAMWFRTSVHADAAPNKI